jgi:hypothetical protein
MRKIIGAFGWVILILGCLAGAMVLLNAPPAAVETVRSSIFAEPRIIVDSTLRQAHLLRGFAILGSSLISGLLLCGVGEALDRLVAIREILETRNPPSSNQLPLEPKALAPIPSNEPPCAHR